ncbi:sugar transporter [Phytophthora cinnamomi]|uniref:sugar transporter n=1 Tax=Phytophthora cinnamomi TaxID=4785 RepID=UPI003559B82E|nr:sugar transporter [Phytophthora cinnamomi]
MPALDSTMSSSDLEQGGSRMNGSWENLKKSEGLKDRARTMHNLKYYGEEQKRLYQELPFRVLAGMRRRSFRSERDFPQLRPRSSWANLSRLVKKHGEQQTLLEDGDDGSEPGYTYPLLFSCLVAVINAFQYGYNTAVTGAMNSAVVFPGHSDMLWALCVSSFAVGGPIGSIAGGQLSAQIGRKKTMLANSCLFILSGAIMAFAINIYMLIAGRFLLSGINAVMFYASSFFQNAGLEDPLVGITLVYIVNVLATIVALMLMDSAGRRPLLLWSVVGMLVSSGILTVGLMDLLPFANMFSVGGVMSFVWFFEIGLGPIPWLIAAEMFPPKSRTTATSIATMVNWLGLFIIGIVFPTMQNALGDYIFVPFAILLCLTLAFSLKFVPETKGKTLDEIQEEINPY